MLALNVQIYCESDEVPSAVLSLTWTSFGSGWSRRRCVLFLSAPFPAVNTSSNWKFGWPCLFTWLKCGEVVCIFLVALSQLCSMTKPSHEMAVGAVWSHRAALWLNMCVQTASDDREVKHLIYFAYCILISLFY